MRQFSLAMSSIVVAIATCGCGQNSEADRSATKVVRPEEVKISLGNEAESKPAPAAETLAAPEGTP